MAIWSAINFARRTGTAFPTICSAFVLEPTKLKPGGKVWISARSAVVNGRACETGAESPGCPG